MAAFNGGVTLCGVGVSLKRASTFRTCSTLTRPDGGNARPKGSAVTADGRYAVISGGARTTPNTVATGTVHIIDLKKRAVVATVTGVGNDPYGLAVVDLKDRDHDD